MNDDQQLEQSLRQHYQQQRSGAVVPAFADLTERRAQPPRRSFALPAFATAAVLLLVTAVLIKPLTPPSKQFEYETLEMAIEQSLVSEDSADWQSPTDYLLEPEAVWAQP